MGEHFIKVLILMRVMCRTRVTLLSFGTREYIVKYKPTKQWHLKSHVVFKGSKQYLISTLEYLIDDAHYIFTVNTYQWPRVVMCGFFA